VECTSQYARAKKIRTRIDRCNHGMVSWSLGTKHGRTRLIGCGSIPNLEILPSVNCSSVPGSCPQVGRACQRYAQGHRPTFPQWSLILPSNCFQLLPTRSHSVSFPSGCCGYRNSRTPDLFGRRNEFQFMTRMARKSGPVIGLCQPICQVNRERMRGPIIFAIILVASVWIGFRRDEEEYSKASLRVRDT
jgi:hypothetical protein